MKTKRTLSLIFGGLFAIIFCLSGCCSTTKSTLVLNKESYLLNEEIYVTATGKGDSWVGIYRVNENVEKVDPIKWYYIDKDGYVSGQTYGLRKSVQSYESRSRFKDLPADNYKAVYFAKYDSNSAKFSVNFTVTNEALQKPEAPTEVDYKLKNESDGLAAGTITLTFDENYTADEVVMYWADDNGQLSDYTALANYKIKQNPQTIELPERMIIPEKATKLLVYSKNPVGISDSCCEFKLPEGCQYKNESQLITEFQVVSDIHIQSSYKTAANNLHDQHFLAMCNDIAKNSPNSSAVVVVGDIADSGARTQWDRMNELRGRVEGLPDFYFSLGNHDCLLGMDAAKTYFYKYANTDSIYYERVLNGYHHIFLGQEQELIMEGDAYLSEAQLNWFEEKLQAATEEDPNKPIFVYLHQSLADTVAGSLGGKDGQGWNGVVQDKQLREILEKYKQVYMFNGHSHWDMNSEQNMYVENDKLPNIFNTSSVAYLWTSFYVPKGENLEGSQGYYIKVYKDKILVLGRDFVEGKWIPSACYEAKH